MNLHEQMLNTVWADDIQTYPYTFVFLHVG
jgi:hypothetical protein